MKKLSLIPILLVAAIVALSCLAPAMAQTPFRTAALAYTASLSYTNDFKVYSATLFVPKFVYVTGTETGSTAIVKAIVGTVTNTLASKELTASDRLITISNTYYVFKGDTFAVTGCASGTTWTAIGLEQ